MRALLTLILCFVITNIQAQEHEHGYVNSSTSDLSPVWNADKKQWTDIESFWQDFANTNEAKSWSQSEIYPNYDDVNEFDTFVIELKQGTCLMQFYHARWRRANDVQRWDDAFNEYGACPYVFD